MKRLEAVHKGYFILSKGSPITDWGWVVVDIAYNKLYLRVICNSAKTDKTFKPSIETSMWGDDVYVLNPPPFLKALHGISDT